MGSALSLSLSSCLPVNYSLSVQGNLKDNKWPPLLTCLPLSPSLSHSFTLISMISVSLMLRCLLHSICIERRFVLMLQFFPLSNYFCLSNSICSPMDLLLCVFVFVSSLPQVSSTSWSASIPSHRCCAITSSLKSCPCSTPTAFTWETTGQKATNHSASTV